jgi:hypothetical protein
MNNWLKPLKMVLRITAPALLLFMLAAVPASAPAQYLGTLPRSLAGTWRITRLLPTTNSTCWTRQQAEPLLGSTLTYSPSFMRWRGGKIEVTDISLREVTNNVFRQENDGPESPADFSQLGIRSRTVTEVDLQHEDAAVMPASTAVPGDSVLLVAPNRIVVSACGVYFEATRAGSMNTNQVASR